MKVAFVGLYDCKNFGDPVLAKCTEWLFCNFFEGLYVEKRLSMDTIYLHSKKKPSFVERVCLSIYRRYNISFIFNIYLRYATYWYFKKELRSVDLVILTGGGIIKYKAQEFWIFVPAIIKAVEKLKKRVILNSVGVEGYDINDSRCRALKNALNSKSVLHISTRDDYQTLFFDYFDGHPKISVTDVADPAVWTKETFNSNKDNINSRTIGLGVARGDIFMDHGINISKESVFSLYYEIASKLIENNYELEIYTNGADCDKQMALDLYQRLLEAGYKLSMKIPGSSEKLIRQIISYQGIVATRLHSCIIAYSHDIPAIGLVWNDKLSLFGKKIHADKYYIQPGEFYPEVVVERLELALNAGYDPVTRKIFRDTIVQDIVSIKELIPSQNYDV